MRRFNLFTMALISIFLVFTSIACTKEKAEEPDNKEVYELASSKNTGPKVGIIESVDKPFRGKAVNFTWTENGKTYNFADFTKNKVVLINFWGTWCGPCRIEIPDLIELNNELPDKDFVLFGISLERSTVENNLNTVKNFMKINNITYRSLLPKNPRNPSIANAYGGIQAVPTTLIIDRKGYIVETIIGPRRKAQFLDMIKRAMK
jgi:thiol-disulfide isomerase/thioredoxin